MTRILLLLLVAGCTPRAPSATAPPAMGARAWADALAKDRPRDAYALLSRAVRRRVPYALFQERWREQQKERARQREAMAGALSASGQRGERGVLATGKERVALVHEQSGWRLESPLIYPTRADTPQAMLRALATAMEERDVDGVLRLISRARRERLQERLRLLIRGLEQHAADPVELVRDRAVLRWNDGEQRWRIVLVREGGEWRLDDIDAE